MGGVTQQAQGGIQGFNTNLATMTGFLGTAASGALQFATSLSNLHGAQIKLEAAQGKLSAANEAVVKAQTKLNELYASGKASAEDIGAATLDLQQAQDKAGIASDRVGKAQDDLNIKYAKFGTDVLPQLIQTVTSTIAVLGTMKAAISGINFAPMATSIMTVAVPALAALYTAIGVLESVPALTKSVSAAIQKDMDGMMTNLDEFLGTLERFASILPGLGGAPLKLAREALDQYAKSQGVATKEVDASIPSLLNAETHQKNLGEAIDILTGKNTGLGTSQQTSSQATEQQTAAIAASKAEIEGARAGIDGYVAGIQKQVDASGTLESKLRQTNTAMQETVSQTMALVGSSENADNAILKLNQSYADHQVKIDQLNTTLNTAAGQMASYQNAVAAGNEQFLQWVQTTRDAATQAETFKGNLEGLANTFGGLPEWVEPTVENLQAFIRANTEGGDAAKEFARISLESYRSLVSEAEPLFNDLKQAVQDLMEGKFIESSDIEGALINPIQAAFDKLPPLVAATLDETEREALTFSAEFANIGEQAGTAWANNLKAHVDMGETFDQALAAANQAAIDIIAPFVEAHPETAQMIQPLIDALNTGTPQAVQEALTSLAGMPGPFQEQAQGMLTEWNKMTGQLGPSLKTGVEGGLADLTQIMSEGMEKIVTKLDTLINTGIKQKPENIPQITANVNPANTQIQLIGKALTDMKVFLEKEENKITIHATETNPLDAQIQLIGTSLQQVKDLLAVPLTMTISTDAAKTALDGLTGQIDAMAGKNVTITVDTGPAGIAITGLQGQIDAVHGKNVTITVDTGPAGIAITTLQGDIDAVHGKNVQITVDTGPAGIAITGLQGDIDAVHGTNVYITVDTSGAQEAIRQLQNQINSLQQSMGGIGGGYTPGYQSPYGSYQGAYGSPYGYAQGFGPAVVNRPTRMLVGEAGPEFVSVIPMKGRNKKNPPRSITAADGMGQQYQFGQNYGYTGQGLWQTDAEEEAYKRQVQAAMQQGSQQGSEQGSQQGAQQGMQQGMPGMQQAVQEGAQQGVQDGMQQGGGGGGGYPMAPSNTEIFGAGRFTWGGGASGTQLGAPGGGGAQYPTAPSNTELWGHPQTFTWRGGASGTQLGAGGMGGGGFGGAIPPNFWTGTGGGMGGGGQAFPGVYTGQVPANYGQPLGQSINGIKATILPGQGPIRQAASGDA